MEKQKLFLIVVVLLAVLVRVFALAVFPESALNDGILHLYLAKGLTTNLPPVVNLPPPLQHFTLAFFYSFTRLEWQGLLLKIVPFILSITFLAGCFILFRKVLGKNYLLAFAFVAINPWLVLYFSINYTEAFTATMLVFSALFALRFFEKPGLVNSLLLGLGLSALALSKLNATVVAIAFFCSVVAVSVFYRRRLFASFKELSVSLFSLAFFSALLPITWFFFQYLRDGFFILPNVAENVFSYPLPSGANQFIMFFKSVFLSIIEFWGFPSASIAEKALSQNLLFAAMIVFFAMVLLLCFALLKGFFLMLKDSAKNKFLLAAFAVIGVNFLFILLHGNPFLAGDSLYWRYFIPALPLTAIPLAMGFDSLSKNKLLHNAALACFFLFSIFSAAYSTYFSLHFYKTHSGYEALYDYLDTLPENSAVFTSDLGRQVSFFSKTPVCSASTWNSNLQEDPKAIVFHSAPEESARIMRDGNCTHLIVTSYYREAWKPEQIQEMLNEGVLESLFEKESFTVYKIN